MIRQELIRFLLVGVTTVLVDFLTYQALLWAAVLDIDMAKALAFFTGTMFAYVANRHVTFAHRQPVRASALRFGLLYALTLGLNVGVNHLLRQSLPSSVWAIHIAFLVATALSATTNFLGMKFLVFSRSP